jgi:hypothetical protein
MLRRNRADQKEKELSAHQKSDHGSYDQMTMSSLTILGKVRASDRAKEQSKSIAAEGSTRQSAF